MKDKTTERIRFIAEIGIALVSLAALFVSWQSIRTAQQANEIAKSGVYPSVIFLESQPGFPHSKACRTHIRLANIGGARTDLMSYSVILHIAKRHMVDTVYEEAVFSIDNAGQTYSGPDVEEYGDISLTSSVWPIEPTPLYANVEEDWSDGMLLPDPVLPIPLESHTTALVIIDVGIKFEDYRIITNYSWRDEIFYDSLEYKSGEVEPIEVKVEFILNFHGAGSVTVPPEQCMEIVMN